MNSYFNTDFKTGIDWNAVGDYSSAFNKPNSGSSSSSGQDKWKDALSKGLSWLASDKNKYRLQGERKQDGVGFMPRSSDGGGSLQSLGKDSLVWVRRQQAPFTVQAPQSGGGIGSTIGGLVGIGGQALGVFGPLGYAAGTLAGKAADEFKLFG